MGRFFHGDTFQPCGVVECPLNINYNCADCNIFNGLEPRATCTDKGVEFNE